MDHRFILRNKKGSYNVPVYSQDLLIEWEIISFERHSTFSFTIEILVEASWDEHLVWKLNKNSDDIFYLSRKKRISLLTKTDEESLIEIEENLSLACQIHPKEVLQFLEISRWTFAKENIYKESLGNKIKEGGLIKASGGYESYNKSRYRVLIAQAIVVPISVLLWFLLENNNTIFYVGFAVISILSLAHWSYYRLSAIDATCILPCLFLPPVGPILILVWTAFNFTFFARGNIRWFVLRPGHLEYYESWGTPKRDPIGILLLDGSTNVVKSRLFSTQFICITAHRTLRLWAKNSGERDDWIEKLLHTIEMERGQRNGDINSNDVPTSFSPARERTPIQFLIDGRDTYVEMSRALRNAKKEIFIAGWMLSPELYLNRPISSSGLLCPETESGLFHTQEIFRVDPRRKYSYQSSQEVLLTSYEIIVHTKRHNLSWKVKGRRRNQLLASSPAPNSSSPDWKELDSQHSIDFRYRDVGEPVRFRIRNPIHLCDEFEFSFFENSIIEEEEEEKDMGISQNTSWIDVNVSSFECGGVRLFHSEEFDDLNTSTQSKPIEEEEEEILEQVSNQDDKIGRDEDEESTLNRFFRLLSRTAEEYRLDQLYSMFVGSPKPIPSKQSNEKQDEYSLPPSVFLEHEEEDDIVQPSNEIPTRLDRILAAKALEGVKCYILVYRDVDMFLPNASFFAKRKLLAASLWNRNIQIIRHAPEGRSYGSVQHLFSCSLSRGKTWWSHHEKIVCVDQSIAFIGGLDLAFGRFDDSRHLLWDPTNRIWIGKDFYNVRYRDFTSLGTEPFKDSFDRQIIPRMPWHDVQIAVEGAAAIDIARHFIGRWNAEKRELKSQDARFSVLIPRYPKGINQNASEDIEFVAGSQSNLLSVHSQRRNLVRCQILRSVAPWSSPSRIESSILDGYIQLIKESKSFIYIEQQFFSSSLAGKPVRNEVVKVLADRIIRAYQNNEMDFRVIVVLPISPAFEGDVKENYSARSVLHWNLRTIRGMINRIRDEIKSEIPEGMLGFYSLRTAQEFGGILSSEQIYIHSKVLIVDDEKAIIGSANLNDRSLLGSRDSEIAALIYAKEIVCFSINQGFLHLHQKQYQVIEFRRRLFLEHCGKEDIDGLGWELIASENTSLFERAFPEIPRNEYVKFTSARSEVDYEARNIILRGGLQGHLIKYPVYYLSKETQLLPRVVRGEREGVLPSENFT